MLFSKSYLFSVYVSLFYTVHINSNLLSYNPYEFSVLAVHIYTARVPRVTGEATAYNLGTAAVSSTPLAPESIIKIIIWLEAADDRDGNAEPAADTGTHAGLALVGRRISDRCG